MPKTNLERKALKRWFYSPGYGSWDEYGPPISRMISVEKRKSIGKDEDTTDFTW